MKLKTRIQIAFLLAGTMLSATVATHATTLSQLLVQKGVITVSEAEFLQSSGDTGLITLLVNKGVISAAEATALSKVEPVRQAVPATPKPEQSFAVKAKEKAVQSITISGRLHGQLDALSTSYDQASDPGSETNLFLRRVYLGVSASFADGLTGVFNANFANGAEGAGEVEKALIEYEFSPNHTFSAGFQKTPLGYEETTSSSKISAVERSVTTRYFTEQLDLGARHTGLFLDGSYDSGLYFTLAATDPEQNNLSDSSSTDKVALWGRLGWEGDIGSASVDAGLAAATIPGSLNSGTTDTVWNLYANISAGNFGLLAELIGGSIEDEGYMGADAKPLGYTIQPVFKIADNFDIVARYAHLDTDGGIGADISSTFRRAPENGGARYDEVTAYYLGGNWYIRGNTLKLSAGYEWATYEDILSGSQGDADVDGFRTRLQLLF